ncbi:hypothetical protein NF868_11875 [Bacillus zhangzhouensis]|nr:hypothetical protein NF868_11875 [Bacillus zhangzhouensis]
MVAAENRKPATNSKESIVKVDQYGKAIHAEVERGSSGTSRAKTIVFITESCEAVKEFT